MIVNVSSRYTKDPTKGRADGYQQTLIVIFVAEDLKTQTFSESKIISLKADPGEQEIRCVVPSSSTTAIVVLKCNFSIGQTPMNLQKSMGMKVVGVLAL